MIAQVETERGLDAVEDIAAVDGVDVIWIGQFDLTNFLGVPGEFDSPTYLDAVARISKAARDAGKALGIMAPSTEWAQSYAAEGFNMIAAGTDQSLLAQSVAGVLDGAR